MRKEQARSAKLKRTTKYTSCINSDLTDRALRYLLAHKPSARAVEICCPKALYRTVIESTCKRATYLAQPHLTFILQKAGCIRRRSAFLSASGTVCGIRASRKHERTLLYQTDKALNKAAVSPAVAANKLGIALIFAHHRLPCARALHAECIHLYKLEQLALGHRADPAQAQLCTQLVQPLISFVYLAIHMLK